MKKTRENISLFELSKMKSQKNSLLKALGTTDKSPLYATIVANKGNVVVVHKSSINR